MARDVLGHIDCPHCGGAATVHQNARGAALLYYRCGEVVAGFSSGCGTVQIYGRSGQEWIKKHMKGLGSDPKGLESLPAKAEEEAPAPIAGDPMPGFQKPRKSILGSLAHLLVEE